MKTLKKIIIPFLTDQYQRNKEETKGISDILVIEHENGQLRATSFLAFFGEKFHKSTITVRVNGKHIKGIDFSVDEKGYMYPSNVDHQILEKLELRYGCNQICFSIKKKKEIQGQIFLFCQQEKFIVTDLDGTMTKNDLGGWVNNFGNRNFLHEGFQQLIDKAAQNGYRVIFLTMRPFVLYEMTKNYLRTFMKSDAILILQNSNIAESLVKQILNLAVAYKDKSMKMIRGLFPLHEHPFYAAFGNRDSDELVYDRAGIPSDKIFIIDEESVVHCRLHEPQSYNQIYKNINEYFPEFVIKYEIWKERVHELKKATQHKFIK